MKTLITIAAISLWLPIATAQTTIPHDFQAGTPARASEVNENFDTLEQAIQQLENPTSTIRGQVLTAVPIASELRFLVAELYHLVRIYPTDNSEVGAPSPTEFQNNFVSSVAINGGTVEVTFGNAADPAIQNETMSFSPAVSGDRVYFLCNPSPAIAQYFDPSSCVLDDTAPEPLTGIRRQVASVFEIANEPAWLLREYFEIHGSLPVNNSAAGAFHPNYYGSSLVESVEIIGGQIFATFGHDASAQINTLSMRFSPDYSSYLRISWACDSLDIEGRYTNGFRISGLCNALGNRQPTTIGVTRQQVESSYPLADILQTLVENFWQANGFWPSSNAEVGALSSDNYQNSYVSGVEVIADGVVSVSFGNNAYPDLNGESIIFTPTDSGASVDWECTPVLIEQRFLPRECYF